MITALSSLGKKRPIPDSAWDIDVTRLSTLSERTISQHFTFSPSTTSYARKVASQKGERDKLFRQFLSSVKATMPSDRRQMSLESAHLARLWVVDKYDPCDFIDRHDDLEALQFADNSFEGAGCQSSSTCVIRPGDSAPASSAETGRHRVGSAALSSVSRVSKDYCRVTPDG